MSNRKNRNNRSNPTELDSQLAGETNLIDLLNHEPVTEPAPEPAEATAKTDEGFEDIIASDPDNLEPSAQTVNELLAAIEAGQTTDPMTLEQVANSMDDTQDRAAAAELRKTMDLEARKASRHGTPAQYVHSSDPGDDFNAYLETAYAMFEKDPKSVTTRRITALRKKYLRMCASTPGAALDEAYWENVVRCITVQPPAPAPVTQVAVEAATDTVDAPDSDPKTELEALSDVL